MCVKTVETADENQQHAEDDLESLFITETGTKYHRLNDCAGLNSNKKKFPMMPCKMCYGVRARID